MSKQVEWGIYAWVHVSTDRTYVGQTGPTEGFRNRRNRHLRKLRRGTHPSRHLQNAWNKYGEFEFIWVVLEDTTDGDVDLLTPREQFWMDNTDSEFNTRPAAGSMRGYKFTPEQRAYQSEMGKKTWPKGSFSDEHRAKISESKRGQKHTPETIARLSELKRGIIPIPESLAKRSKTMRSVWESPEYREKMAAINASPERRARLSEAQRRNWEDTEYRAHMIQVSKDRPPVTDEFRAKMSEIVRARPPTSAETCARISEGKRGWNPSAETRANMSAAHKGKTPSPETRARMSAAQKRRNVKQTP